MWNDGEQIWDQGGPFPTRDGVIIHHRGRPDSGVVRGPGFRPPGGEDHKSLELYQDEDTLPGVAAWEL